MRIRAVIHYLGLFLASLGALMCVPLVVSVIYKEPDTRPLLLSAGITVLAGLLLWLLPSPRINRLSRREALLLVTSIWVLAGVFGSLPFKLSGALPSYVDAFFETISGFTTSGASVLVVIESLPHGILFWRDFIQWLGGMGIVVLFVAVFPLIGVGAASLVESEMPGPESDRLTARIRDTARIMWQLYIGISALEILALFLAGMPIFDAIANTFGTMATGGFSPANASIGAYNNIYVEVIIIVFMMAAGTNFQIYYLVAWKREWSNLFANRELRLYIGIISVASILVALDLIFDMKYSVGLAFRYGIFQVVSIQTTTGFATTDFALWPSFSRLILLLLMVIGASASSTGGGLKVVRVLVLWKYIYSRILFFVSPRSVRPIKVADRALGQNVVSQIVSLSGLYFMTVVTGSLVMAALGLDLESAVASVLATLGNVGPGLASVGPAANYFSIPAIGKVVLSVCMLVGRLELWTAISILTPLFWRNP
jgi:trk system potassium uptake protein TrkH